MWNRPGFLTLAAVLLFAAACGSGPSAPRVAGSTGQGHATVSSPTAQRQRAWVTFAACLRSHGANVPDPTFDENGNPLWAVNPPPKASSPATQACKAEIPAFSADDTPKVPTADELARETRWAQCVRQHGVPTFPDPDPQTGGFNGGPQMKTDPAYLTAYQACQQLNPWGK